MRTTVFTLTAYVMSASMVAACANRVAVRDDNEEGVGTEDGSGPEAGEEEVADGGVSDGGDKDPGPVDDDCTDHHFAVTDAHVLLESTDGVTWSTALEDPNLGSDVAATQDRAYVTGANGWSWSREAGVWAPSTLGAATVQTAATEADLVAITSDNGALYVQQEDGWTVADAPPFAGVQQVRLIEGPRFLTEYYDPAMAAWQTSVFDGIAWSPSQTIPWSSLSKSRLSSSNGYHMVTGPEEGTEVWSSADGLSWSLVGPLNLPYEADFEGWSRIEFQSESRMLSSGVFAWAGYDIDEYFSQDPIFRITLMFTSDYNTWTVIPLDEWRPYQERDEWRISHVEQMSNGRLLVGGAKPSGGALWIVDMEDEAVSLVASALPGTVRSIAISRCE